MIDSLNSYEVAFALLALIWLLASERFFNGEVCRHLDFFKDCKNTLSETSPSGGLPYRAPDLMGFKIYEKLDTHLPGEGSVYDRMRLEARRLFNTGSSLVSAHFALLLSVYTSSEVGAVFKWLLLTSLLSYFVLVSFKRRILYRLCSI